MAGPTLGYKHEALESVGAESGSGRILLEMQAENPLRGSAASYTARTNCVPSGAGSRVRARFTLKTFGAQTEGRYQSTIEVAVEIEGQDKPALVLEWLTMTFV